LKDVPDRALAEIEEHEVVVSFSPLHDTIQDTLVMPRHSGKTDKHARSEITQDFIGDADMMNSISAYQRTTRSVFLKETRCGNP
jgi:hypothetical protein